MTDKNGVIYILTNPSFPKYVKIGYADDVNKRLRQLNRSECVPFAFRVYATYEVSSRLPDLNIPLILDKLNPNLRSIKSFDGKQHGSEFYAMSPEDAYSILEAIAEIHGCSDNLKLIAPDNNNNKKQVEDVAKEKNTKCTNKAAAFSFNKCQIPAGSKIQYCHDPEITATVVDDRKVEYNGEIMSLSALAKLLLGISHAIAGPQYFKYNGELLNDIRHRLGV